jgi:hypothetical protein
VARLVILALIVVASFVGATPDGVAQQSGVAVDIRQGNCEELGDVVAPLVAATIPEGEPRGNAAAMAAASSFTTVPLSLEALITGDHAIVMPFPAGDEVVACGEIGGVLTEAGALVVGIRPQGEEDISGIAFLSPSADPAQTSISLFLAGESFESFLATTFLPPEVVTEDDAARFAEALAARNDDASLAGPFAGTLVQQEGLRTVYGAGISTEAFSATVAFTNPTVQTESPWDVGIAFRGTQDTAQIVALASDGSWYFTDSLTGMILVGWPPVSNFDAAPGATNTLDLIVQGSTARFGVNGEMVATIDLPRTTTSDVIVGTGWFSDNAVEGREIVFGDFEVWEAASAAPAPGTPPEAAAEDDAVRFAAALAARGDSPALAGPFGGTLHQRAGVLAAAPAGIATEDFSATVTFVNPSEQSGAPWDYGFAFHQVLEPYGVQEVYVDSGGFWSYADFPNGVQQSGLVPTFDAAPGATNTLDLIVQGTTALFGVNGEFVATIDLTPPIAADVMAATDFASQNIVEGREIIYSTFEVWEAPTPAALAASPPPASTLDDATRFADALAARDAMREFGSGPFTDTLVQQQASPTSRIAEIDFEDLSATAAFTNPAESSGVPWDYGFAFHPIDNAVQVVYVDSDGFWYFNGTRAGWLTTFDSAPEATNTLDLIVEGDTALFGVNGEFVASLDLPDPTSFRIGVVTGLEPEYQVEGREIDFTLQVWY